MITDSQKRRICPLSSMITYGTGACSESLVLNAIFGFAMMYYTDALGLSPFLAGLAMFIATLWDAFTDPVMGHLSDNTRSRYGRRHQYMLVGGLLMIATFLFVWYVPGVFKGNTVSLFLYLVVMNLLVRTGYTIFSIPYTALGFEICTDYNGRTKLQGIRFGMNMAANLCGPALAWTVFFSNNEPVRATNVADNYVLMGTFFSLAALVFVLFVVFSTLKYIQDSREMKLTGNSLKAFFIDMKEIITDLYPRWVFAFLLVVVLGVALVSNLQMYVFEHFMVFSGPQKTVAHGGTMVGAGLGALIASAMTRRFDKKGTIYIAGLMSVFCELMLAVLFLPEILKPGQTFQIAGFGIPIAFIVFSFFHTFYWLGWGVMLPVATSMMADVSEINEIKTGINKDGSYAAMFTFTFKFAMSLGVFISGNCLSMIGFQAGAEHGQAPEVIWRLCAVMLLAGPLISFTALGLMMKYPVTKTFVEKMREERNAQGAE